MGIICQGNTINKDNEIIKMNPISIKTKHLDKIILIQRLYRRFKAKNNIEYMKKIKYDIIYKELDAKRLIDFNLILQSKSEIFYKNLLSSEKIELFEEIIKLNKNIQNKLTITKKNSFNFPFYVIISQEKIYKGSWNYSKKFHGYGVIYEFNFKNNKDCRIEGIFTDGLLNGFGRIFFSNDELIFGNFLFSKLNGLGEYYRNDGSVYRGSFFEGFPQGNGEETFDDGSSFNGFYLAGKKKHGKFLWKNGNYYEGEFSEDLFHGFGTYQWRGQQKYEGNWKKGKMNGKGKITYVDGSYYDGEFCDGIKCGKGIYFWNKDRYYEGEWKDDKQNGYGTYYKKGIISKGFWINGKIFSDCHSLNNSFICKAHRLNTIHVSNCSRKSEIKSSLLPSDASSLHNTMKIMNNEMNSKHKILKPQIYKAKKIKEKCPFGRANKRIISNIDQVEEEEKNKSSNI